MRAMKTVEHIRKHVFAMSQKAFAEELDVNQSTVSRWEQGVLEPSHSEMDSIRRLAKKRNVYWDDRWFFEPPGASSAA